MRSLSFLDFLCLDFLLKKFGLPLVHFVNDLGLWILEPFGKGERRLSLRRQIPEAEALESTVGDGFSALLFLRRPPKLGTKTRRGRALQVDLIATLVAKQRVTERPILLVPQTFVWSKQAGTATPSLLDLLFGPVQWPGRVRVFFQFLLNYRDAKLRSGEPFNLKDFLEKHSDLDDAEAANKVRYGLLRRMERDRAVIIGPMKKTTARIQDEILRSPRVRGQIERYAQEKGISYSRAEHVARKQLQKLCAKQSLFVVDLMHRFLTWMWSKIYDGVVVDPEGIERVREAAREGTLVLLPSHKSHVDYLVLSDVMYAHEPDATAHRGRRKPQLLAAWPDPATWGRVLHQTELQRQEALLGAGRCLHAQADGGGVPDRVLHRRRSFAHRQVLAPEVRIALDGRRCPPRCAAPRWQASFPSPSATSASSRSARTFTSSPAVRSKTENMGGLLKTPEHAPIQVGSALRPVRRDHLLRRVRWRKSWSAEGARARPSPRSARSSSRRPCSALAH